MFQKCKISLSTTCIITPLIGLYLPGNPIKITKTVGSGLLSGDHHFVTVRKRCLHFNNVQTKMYK